MRFRCGVIANGIVGFNTSVGWVRFLSAIRQGQALTHRGSNGLISTDTLTGWVDTGGVRDLFSWHTDDPWPTTLPGTAVGAIPNA